MSQQRLKISTDEILLILITDIWCHNNFWETLNLRFIFALYVVILGLNDWCHYQSCPLRSTSTSEVKISQFREKIRQNCNKIDDLFLFIWCEKHLRNQNFISCTLKNNWHMTSLIRKSLAKQKLRLQTVYVINSAIFKSSEIHWWVKLLRYDAKGYKSNSYPNFRCKWFNHLCT